MTKIATARMDIVPLETADAVVVHRLFGAPGVRRFLFEGDEVEGTFVDDIITASRQDFSSTGAGLWGLRDVEHENHGALWGIAGIHRARTAPEVIIALDPERWQQSLGTEALTAIFACVRGQGRLRTLSATADWENLASRRLLERAGMIATKRVTDNGRDCACYQLDWER